VRLLPRSGFVQPGSQADCLRQPLTSHVRPMRRLFAILVISISSCSSPERTKLLGTWTSDKERTMSFIQDHVKIPEKTERFFGELMGNLSVTFAESRVSYLMPDVYVTLENEKKLMVGFEETSSYAVLYEDEKTVVISGTAPVSGTEETTTYYFEGSNSMWVYIGTVDPFFPDLHIREYFKRVDRGSGS